MPSDRTVRRVAAQDRAREQEAIKRKRQKKKEYAAERILRSQHKANGTTVYQVRWAAPFNDPSYDSWEPVQNLSNGLLREYGGAEGDLPDETAIAKWRRTDSLVGCRGVDPTVRGHAAWSFLKAVMQQQTSDSPRQHAARATSAAGAAAGRDGSSGEPVQRAMNVSNDPPAGAPGAALMSDSGSTLSKAAAEPDASVGDVAPATPRAKEVAPASKATAAGGGAEVDADVQEKKQALLSQ